jgi:hypothetical protein
MPDIAMCENNNCPRRAECYRFSAKPSEYRQAYIAPEPDGCAFFVPVEPKRGGDNA